MATITFDKEKFEQAMAKLGIEIFDDVKPGPNNDQMGLIVLRSNHLINGETQMKTVDYW